MVPVLVVLVLVVLVEELEELVELESEAVFPLGVMARTKSLEFHRRCLYSSAQLHWRRCKSTPRVSFGKNVVALRLD